MKILWVATKPPWPLIDGGRLVQWHTLTALAQRDVEVTLVAPADSTFDPEVAAKRLSAICHPILVPHAPRSWMQALPYREPLSISRHRIAGVRLEIEQWLARGQFDVVHAEQLQALANCAEVRQPLVLRAQNVESDLWFALGAHRPILSALLNFEAGRLRAWEAAAISRCHATIALTINDAAKLETIAQVRGKIHCIAAPFPAVLHASEQSALSGRPPLVILGSSRWAPNRDGANWFVREIWPAVLTRLPGAMLHLYTGGAIAHSRNVVVHRAPEDSAEAFAPGAMLIVPLRIASGLRMKILEAWARGVPVVATPDAAQGLGATDRRELMIARNGEEFASAIATLAEDDAARTAMVTAAREFLRANHNPTTIADRMLAIYREVITSQKAR